MRNDAKRVEEADQRVCLAVGLAPRSSPPSQGGAGGVGSNCVPSTQSRDNMEKQRNELTRMNHETHERHEIAPLMADCILGSFFVWFVCFVVINLRKSGKSADAVVHSLHFLIDFSGISKIPFRCAKDSSGFFKDSKDFATRSDTCEPLVLAIVYSVDNFTRPPPAPPCEGGEPRAGQAPRLNESVLAILHLRSSILLKFRIPNSAFRIDITAACRASA